MKKVKLQYDNMHITESHVRYWDIGQEMELIYTIETTKHDEEVKIDFSNIYKHECNSLNEVFYIFNVWQKAGYKNIQIVTNVKHNNEVIIEDVSECLELSINSEEMNQLKNDSRQLENASQEIAVYKGFIKQHKAEKMFNEFMANYTNNPSNKDENNLYWYEMLYRPLSPFCQPKNHIKYDDSRGRHGIIAYNRPLNDDELNEYELREWSVIA